MAMIAAPLFGALSWIVLEYALHRFVGHARDGRSLFAREHRRHHARGDYFAPAAKKALVTGPIFGAVGILGWLALGPAGAAYAASLASTYLAYEVFHRRLHTHPPKTRFGRWARRHHFHHHFVNPRANHGVTTPLADLVLGTRARLGPIPVPERLAMAWLLDPRTGEVCPAYAGDYRLARRGRRLVSGRSSHL